MKHWFKAVQHQHTQCFQWPIFHGLWREWNISIHLTLEASWKGTVTLLLLFVFYLKCKLTNYNCWEEYKIQRMREPFFPSTFKMQLLENYIKCFTWISECPRFNCWTLFTMSIIHNRKRQRPGESVCLLGHTSILLYIFIKYVFNL